MAEDIRGKVSITAETEAAEKALKSLSDEFDTFGKAAESGSVRAEKSGARLLLKMEELRAKIAELGAKGGDTSNYVAELAKMERGFEEGTAKIANFKAAQEDVQKKVAAASAAIGEQRGEMFDLNDILKEVSPQFAGLAIQASAVMNGVNQLAAGLRETASAANDLAKAAGGVGNEFDNLSKLAEPLGLIKVAITEISAAAAGWEAFKETTGTLRQRLLAMSQAMQDVRSGSAEMRKELEGVNVALDQQTRQLAANIATLEEEGKVSEGTRARIVEQIKEQLDAYEKLHKAAPEALAALAEEYDVVSTAADKANEKAGKEWEKAMEEATKASVRAKEEAERLAKQGIKAVGDAAEKAIPQIDKATAALERQAEAAKNAADEMAGKAVSELEKAQAELAALDEKDFLTTEELQRKFDLEDKLNDLRQEAARTTLDVALAEMELSNAQAASYEANQQAVIAAQQAAAQNEQLTASIDTVTASQTAATQAAGDLNDSWIAYGGEIDTLAGVVGTAAAQTITWKDAQGNLHTEVMRTVDVTQEATKATDEAGKSTKNMADSADAAARGFSEANAALKDTVKLVDEANGKFREALTLLAEIAEAI